MPFLLPVTLHDKHETTQNALSDRLQDQTHDKTGQLIVSRFPVTDQGQIGAAIAV